MKTGCSWKWEEKYFEGILKTNILATDIWGWGVNKIDLDILTKMENLNIIMNLSDSVCESIKNSNLDCSCYSSN